MLEWHILLGLKLSSAIDSLCEAAGESEQNCPKHLPRNRLPQTKSFLILAIILNITDSILTFSACISGKVLNPPQNIKYYLFYWTPPLLCKTIIWTSWIDGVSLIEAGGLEVSHELRLPRDLMLPYRLRHTQRLRLTHTSHIDECVSWIETTCLPNWSSQTDQDCLTYWRYLRDWGCLINWGRLTHWGWGIVTMLLFLINDEFATYDKNLVYAPFSHIVCKPHSHEK